MKIITASSGKKSLKLSKTDWKSIGLKAGWLRQAMPVVQNIKSLDGMNVTLLNRSEHPSEVVKFFTDKLLEFSKNRQRFGIGTIKADGSYREYNAQKLAYYKYSDGAGSAPRNNQMSIVDLDVAAQIAITNGITKKDILNEDGTINEEKATEREYQLRKAYRWVVLDKIEFIKSGSNLWLVDNPESNEARELLERCNAENATIKKYPEQEINEDGENGIENPF